jgi:hypothetical protein
MGCIDVETGIDAGVPADIEKRKDGENGICEVHHEKIQEDENLEYQ